MTELCEFVCVLPSLLWLKDQKVPYQIHIHWQATEKYCAVRQVYHTPELPQELQTRQTGVWTLCELISFCYQYAFDRFLPSPLYQLEKY